MRYFLSTVALSLCSLAITVTAAASPWAERGFQDGDFFYYTSGTSSQLNLHRVDLQSLEEVGPVALGSSGTLCFLHVYGDRVYRGWTTGGGSSGVNLFLETRSPDLSASPVAVQSEVTLRSANTARAAYRRFLLVRRDERLHSIDLETGLVVDSLRLPPRIGFRGTSALAIDPETGNLGMIMLFEGQDAFGLEFASYILRATVDPEGAISVVSEEFREELLPRWALPFAKDYAGGPNSAQMVPGTWTMVSAIGHAFNLERGTFVGSLGQNILGVSPLADGSLIVTRGAGTLQAPLTGYELFDSSFRWRGVHLVDGRGRLPVAVHGGELVGIYNGRNPSTTAYTERRYSRMSVALLEEPIQVTFIRNGLDLPVPPQTQRAISSDGRFIFEGRPSGFYLFDVAEGRILSAAELEAGIVTISRVFFHPDDGYFYFGDAGGLLRVHPGDPERVEPFLRFHSPFGDSVRVGPAQPVKKGILAGFGPWIDGFKIFSIESGTIQSVNIEATTGIQGIVGQVYLPESRRILVRDRERWHALERSESKQWLPVQAGPALERVSGGPGRTPMVVIDRSERLIWDGFEQEYIDTVTLARASVDLPRPEYMRNPPDAVRSFELFSDGVYWFRLRNEPEAHPWTGLLQWTQHLDRLDSAGNLLHSRLLERPHGTGLVRGPAGVWNNKPFLLTWDGDIPALRLFDSDLNELAPGSRGIPRAIRLGNWDLSRAERAVFTGASPWYWSRYYGWHLRVPSAEADDAFWVWLRHGAWGWSRPAIFPHIYKPERAQWMEVSMVPVANGPLRFRSVQHGYWLDGHTGLAPNGLVGRKIVLEIEDGDETWTFYSDQQAFVHFHVEDERVGLSFRYAYEKTGEQTARVLFESSWGNQVQDGVLELHFDSLGTGNFDVSALFTEDGQTERFHDSGRFRIN